MHPRDLIIKSHYRCLGSTPNNQIDSKPRNESYNLFDIGHPFDQQLKTSHWSYFSYQHLLSLCTSPQPDPGGGRTIYAPELVINLTVQLQPLNIQTEHQNSAMKFSVTAYVDKNWFSSPPALDWNCLCMVEVPSVLADASLRGRLNSGLSCMTLGDMLEYLHHTQTISVKCRQTTRAVIIYVGCDRKLFFWIFGVEFGSLLPLRSSE